MGYQTTETGARARRRAGRRPARARRALLVASTDLSHYHDAATARARSTRVVIDRVSRFDADGLQRALDAQPEHACGGGPTVAVMRAARVLGARDAVVLHYADSGDVSGDKSAVVGYLAAALGRRVVMTSAADRLRLLLRLRATRSSRTLNGRAPSVPALAGALAESRRRVRDPARARRVCAAASVTSKPDEPLGARRRACAVAACSADPRFPAVSGPEAR